ncbi:MAG: TrpB-like pyridoxal phosphate-dependent enzyme [Methanomassiliicoccus sp.]|nr:TrpB-like pyridoxal phosphate-dependent enzyme [Methanomassiliicoccus sp.]
MSIRPDDRVSLTSEEIPKNWYNISADLPEPIPPHLHPGTKEPVTLDDWKGIFSKASWYQETTNDRCIPIPEEVRDAYMMLGRPSPLQRAKRLEAFLKTPAKIYFKREDLSPAGSHKPNSAIPQAYYNMKEGVENLTTETGAGQWGSALALACAHFDMNCTVFMVRVSFDQKPFRRLIMETYGSKVYASPSKETEYGRSVLQKNPEHPGTLGIAISEAIETCVHQPNTKYSLGSVLNHVMLHQTVVGQEVMQQMKKIDITPDYMIGCVGGGSNFAGFSFPMIGEKIKGKNETEFIAVEPTSVPSLTKGENRYDFGDTAGMTPLVKMYTLGCDFVPSPIHAGGLRYHGMAPAVSQVTKLGLVTPVSYEQNQTFEAAITFAKTEGIIPAPESSHAIKAAIDKALEAKRNNEEKVIVFNLSGHGLLDMVGYGRYLHGDLKNSSS